MKNRYRLIIEFNRRFAWHCLHLRELIGLSLVLMMVGGFVISEVEGIPQDDGIYFAFVTGLTIGYGDIAPSTSWGRILSVVVGLIGTLFAGLMVAIASRALHDAVELLGKQTVVPDTTSPRA